MFIQIHLIYTNFNTHHIKVVRYSPGQEEEDVSTYERVVSCFAADTALYSRQYCIAIHEHVDL